MARSNISFADRLRAHDAAFCNYPGRSVINMVCNLQMPMSFFRNMVELEQLPSKRLLARIVRMNTSGINFPGVIKEEGTNLKWEVPPAEMIQRLLINFFEKFDVTVTDEHKRVISECIKGNQEQFYTVYKIPKRSGGERVIEAPCDALKQMQRVILDKVLYPVFWPEAHAHGFVPRRNIVTNAKTHYLSEKATKQVLLKVDLKDCFPSIGSAMIYDSLTPRFQTRITDNKWTAFNDFSGIPYKEVPFLKRVCDLGHTGEIQFFQLKFSYIMFLLGITYMCTLKERLPQGAPTSPALLNAVMRPFDVTMPKNMHEACIGHYIYTRYADDLIISCDSVKDAVKFKAILLKSLELFNLDANPEKIQILRHGRPQRITGVVINHKLSVSRVKRNNIKAMMHNFITGKHMISRHALEVLRGHRAFIKQVNADEWTPKFENMFHQCEELLKK